jgi:hypothetical protein
MPEAIYRIELEKGFGFARQLTCQVDECPERNEQDATRIEMSEIASPLFIISFVVQHCFFYCRI